MPDSPPENADVLAHFTARAGHYDASSHWCTDTVLLDRIRELLALAPDHHLLDVACGTGLVSRAMRPHVATITGVDITPAMFDQAQDCIDTLHAAPAESLPLADNSVDRSSSWMRRLLSPKWYGSPGPEDALFWQTCARGDPRIERRRLRSSACATRPGETSGCPLT